MIGRLFTAICGAIPAAYLFGFAMARSLHHPAPTDDVRAGSLIIVLAWCLLCPIAAAQRSIAKAWLVIGLATAGALVWLALTWLI